MLAELLVCPCCSSWLTQPRSLSCQHSACSSCLEPLLKTCHGGAKEILCPTCSCQTRVASIDELPSSTSLIQLSEFREILRRASTTDTPSPTPTDITNSFDGSFLNLVPARPLSQVSPIVTHCEQHRQLLNIYCHTCKEDICTNCLHGEHMQHQWGPAGEFTTQVTEQLSLAYQTLQQLQNIPVTCEKRLKIVKERQQDIQEEIDTAFKILQEELESKKKQLLRAASNLSQKQLQMLKLHSEKAQQHYKLLAAFYEIASEQMADEVSQKPVIVYRECAQKLDQILATFLPKDKTLPVELKVNLALWQAQSRENKDAFSKYVGQVILRPSAQSKDMSIEGKGAERAIAGLPTHFKVVVVPTEGEPLPMLTDDIICSLEPEW